VSLDRQWGIDDRRIRGRDEEACTVEEFRNEWYSYIICC
jgi:hypothetical protein